MNLWQTSALLTDSERLNVERTERRMDQLTDQHTDRQTVVNALTLVYLSALTSVNDIYFNFSLRFGRMHRRTEQVIDVPRDLLTDRVVHQHSINIRVRLQHC